jgi:hypothetical protein
MEEVARLINQVDALRKEMDGLKSASSGMRAANDNLRSSFNGASTASRAMNAHMVNLSRQVQDVGTMFAMGASPMQVFTSQGFQIADVLAMMSMEAKAANTSLTSMAASGLGKIGPYAIAAAAATAALAAIVSELTDEINETSEVTVTWQDTMLGAMDAVAAFAREEVTAAFEAMGIDVAASWQWLTNAITGYIDRTIGAVVFAVNVMKAAWRTFPAAVAEYFILSVNNAILAMQGLVNRGVNMLNLFGAAASSVFGTDFDPLDQINLPLLENSFRGAGASVGVAMGEAYRSSFVPYLSRVAETISPFAQARAGQRGAANDNESGARGGRGASRRVAQNQREADEIRDIWEDTQRQINVITDEMAEGRTVSVISDDTMRQVNERLNQIRDVMRGFTDDMQKSFDSVGASVSDAFEGMLTGAKSWKDGMRSIINTVISELWRLYVTQQIVGFVSQALGNMGLPMPTPLPGRAAGGPVNAGKPYIVGEKRPELFIPGTSGTIVPSLSGMGGASISVTVDARGSSDPAMVDARVRQGIMEAAPMIIAASQQRTMAAQARPRLGGAIR